MIAYVDIEVHAENPQMPIGPCVAFVGSPSNVRILKVPKGIGSWKIDAVAVAFTRPDNSIATVSAVNVAGCWVATLPASDVGGRCDKGFQIEASGIDENGNAVTGYVLGVGDVVILPRDGTAVSDGVQYYFHYRDAVPATPRKGDTCLIDGTLKWYDGTAWQVFAAGADIDVVPPSTNPADEGKAADAKATGDALAGKRGVMDLGVRGAPTIVDGAAVGKFFVDGVECTFDSSRSSWKISDDYEIDIFDPSTYRFIDYTDPSGEPPEYPILTFELSAANGYAATVLGHEVVGYGGDALAKTSQLPTVPVKAVKRNGSALTPDENGAVDVTVPTQPSDIGAQPAGSYAPATNIAKSALASDVQTSLGKADTAVQPSALAGAVRYDLDAAAATVALPSSAFPIVYTWYDETLGEFVTHTAASAAAVTLEEDSSGDNPGGWRLLHESREIAKFDAYGEYTIVSQDAHLGTITFGELANPPSLVFTVQLTDRAVQKVVLNAASTTLVLPALTDLTGKVADFGIDVINAYEESDEPAAASFSLDGTLGTDYNLVVPKGETWSEMTALAEDEMAQFYFTLSSFQLDNIPTWKVVKQVVELVPVPTAP